MGQTNKLVDQTEKMGGHFLRYHPTNCRHVRGNSYASIEKKTLAHENTKHPKKLSWKKHSSFFRDFVSALQMNASLASYYLYNPLGCSPAQDASHHQDYDIFRIGDPYKPSFATVTGRGDNPNNPYDSISQITWIPPVQSIQKAFGDEIASSAKVPP